VIISAGMTWFGVVMWSGVQSKEQCPSGPDWFSNHRPNQRCGAAKPRGVELQARHPMRYSWGPGTLLPPAIPL